MRVVTEVAVGVIRVCVPAKTRVLATNAHTSVQPICLRASRLLNVGVTSDGVTIAERKSISILIAPLADPAIRKEIGSVPPEESTPKRVA